ncbi:Zinc finger protein grt1 [Trichoderma ghanense]|uniref:Zinc finger protein grt1 n=1 Tax=Trichoderma ghanense TaxID=65468 RepID=A0ABY2H6C0_9HYPO
MTNIGKACEACRARKTRCDGKEPCARCLNRSVSCVYRSRTRNRPRKSQTQTPVAAAAASSSGASNPDVETPTPNPAPGAPDPRDRPRDDNSWGFHVHSVAAITTSPSSIIQLHYGPSSNFSMLHSIYRLITGIQTPLTRREEVAQVGPGLDLFQNRQLFFGDLADGKATMISSDYSAMFLDKELCGRALERYLCTFWHLLPILTKDDFRRRAELLYASPGLFSFDSPDVVVVMLAMAVGASVLEEEAMAQFLFQRASQGADKLSELVNIQAIHIPLLQAQFQLERSRPHSAFLYVGVASRKAVAAGLHRGISIRGQMRDCLQRRLTFWSLFIMETWVCFCLGRPTSISDPGGGVPVPAEEKFILALVRLARLISKCAARIYNQHHESLLHMWNAATELRHELQAYAEEQLLDVHLDIQGEPGTGECGFCKTIIASMYQHVQLLMFRPFLVLRGKLRSPAPQVGAESCDKLRELTWLDTACEYCLEPARQIIKYINKSSEINDLCKETKYFSFFLEGACYVLGFDMLQDKTKVEAHLPWLHAALDCLSSMSPTNEASPSQIQILIKAINRILCTVVPNANPCRGLQSLCGTPQCAEAAAAAGLSVHPNGMLTPSDTASYPPSVPSMSLTYYAPNSARSSAVPFQQQPEGQAGAMSIPGAQDPDFDWRMFDVETLMSIDPFEFILNARMNEEGQTGL